jgi:hypothetical protein
MLLCVWLSGFFRLRMNCMIYIYIFYGNITYTFTCIVGTSHICFKEFIFMVKELVSPVCLLLFQEWVLNFLSHFELLL